MAEAPTARATALANKAAAFENSTRPQRFSASSLMGVSAAATVLQVVQVAAQVTNALGAYISSVKGADSARNQLHGAVLGWFKAVDCTVGHKFTRKQRQKTTGDWLFKEQLYIDWRSNATKFLWLNEKAGAGKSVLAYIVFIAAREPKSISSSSAVVDKLLCDLGHDETLAYFFCDFRN
ncbi:hypothetical protein HYDPIDRAFT_44096 [Hydnomerulius pinastri MD-312]|uniref:Nephrocystin 3-like N-terminal domain-containing protein n=1 Tax=Hydnomerulius pinastri MD-312 TaxID=994086 RepID=A0A0C9W0B0_9AGAM|nr:hypothetical protein HYDPIDRAFT_44096 [Hydnomerulius pinastri MD-312]